MKTDFWENEIFQDTNLSNNGAFQELIQVKPSKACLEPLFPSECNKLTLKLFFQVKILFCVFPCVGIHYKTKLKLFLKKCEKSALFSSYYIPINVKQKKIQSPLHQNRNVKWNTFISCQIMFIEVTTET